MINYLKSELYRVSRTKSTYGILFFPLGVLMFFLILTWLTGLGNENFLYNNTRFIFGFSQASLTFMLGGIPFLVDVLFAGEHQFGTFKNSVSYGVSKRTLYFGKLILTTLVSVIISVIILLVFIPSAELLLQNSGVIYRNHLLSAIWHSVPLFLAALTVSHMLSIIMKKSSAHIGYYFAIVLIIPILLMQMASGIAIPEMIFKLFPYFLIGVEYWQTPMQWLYCWGILGIYFVVTTVIGMNLFIKQDV